MKKLCDLYVAKAEVIGALYCVVPTLLAFVIIFYVMPFREVYVVRLVLAIAAGAPVAAWLNRFGLSLWMIKHASPQGPATVLDGMLIGSSLGMSMALIPGLTHYIASTDFHVTSTSIVILLLSAALAGAIVGGIIGTVGRKYLGHP